MTSAKPFKFFISYNHADQVWAEWIAWQLEAAGHGTVIQAWDFRPGANFFLEMQQAAKAANRTIAVLSPNYLEADFTQPEWAASFRQDPRGEKRVLVPVRVRECEPERILGPIVYVDLVGVTDPADARARLFEGLLDERDKPKPDFPGSSIGPSFPGEAGNDTYEGRDSEKKKTRELQEESSTSIAAGAVVGAAVGAVVGAFPGIYFGPVIGGIMGRHVSDEIKRRSGFVRVPIFFVTDRAKRGGGREAPYYTGARTRARELHYGRAMVTIPTLHQKGAVERPRWWKLDFRETPERHVVLGRVRPVTKASFSTLLREGLREANVPEVLVFIHGYNVSFEDAARRTGQLAHDLEFRGIPMLYSWPSKGTPWKYPVDETNAKWTMPHLQDTLKLLLTKTGAQTVHVIAHSMGNRPLIEALRQLVTAALPESAARLRQIVLAAPDIDSDVFAQLADTFPRSAERVTLYASSHDKALKVSKRWHGYPRAGESGSGLTIVEGVDTIDASASDVSFLAHSTFGSKRSILADIFHLLRHGLPPDDRFGLKGHDSAGQQYWVFEP